MAKSATTKKTKTEAKAAKPAAAPKAVKPKAPAKPKAAAKPKAEPKVKASSTKTISAQERYHMIDEAAYYRAEKAGFQVDPHENWIAAEKEIDELLAKQGVTVG